MALTKVIGAGLGTTTEGTTITTADNDAQLILVCTDTDASTGPKLELNRNPGEAGADGDNLGQIEFYGYNDASQKSQYAYLFAEAADVADGSEDVRFGLGGLVAGADSSLMTFMHGTAATGADPEMVFNDSSRDINFRVESNSNANMLFVDGGTDTVIIGHNVSRTTMFNSTVGGSLQVEGTTSEGGTVSIARNSNDDNGPNLVLAKSNSTSNAGVTVVTDDALLGRISFQGADGSQTVEAARIECFVNGTPGANDMPGELLLSTTPNGSATTSARLRIGQDGTAKFAGGGGSNHLLTIDNDRNNNDGYGLKINAGSNDPAGTHYQLEFCDGDGTAQGSITSNAGTVSYGAFTAFHPCIIPNSDNDADSQDNAYPYGTLLEITSLSYSQKNGVDTERGIRYNVQKSSSAKSKAVLGAYGSSMNGGPENDTNMHQALILGDGHILCNNENGNIAIGDYICTSSTSGEGMKATSICTTIGIAREAITFSNSTAVLVAVEYGYRQFIPEDLETRIKALEG